MKWLREEQMPSLRDSVDYGFEYLGLKTQGSNMPSLRDFTTCGAHSVGDNSGHRPRPCGMTAGQYCVTSKYMRKVVWDGKNLSDKKADGAWKSEYDYMPNPKAMSRGSGNTPTLMSFGPDDDKLVVLADAGAKISVIALWRDEIPAQTGEVHLWARRDRSQ